MGSEWVEIVTYIDARSESWRSSRRTKTTAPLPTGAFDAKV